MQLGTFGSASQQQQHSTCQRLPVYMSTTPEMHLATMLGQQHCSLQGKAVGRQEVSYVDMNESTARNVFLNSAIDTSGAGIDPENC